MPQQPAPALPVTDWFRVDAFRPAAAGYFEVLSSDGISPLLRYWDGSVWRNSVGGSASLLMSRGTDICFRGESRWVLRCQDGATSHYCVEARRAGARWSPHPGAARPFKSQAAAVRFAARYPRLRLTPVLA